MVKHYCDGCGKEVNQDNGVIGMKEVTLEFEDKKVSIAVEVDCMTHGHQDQNPAVCATCIAAKFQQWADSIASVAQSGQEQLISTQSVAGSNPAGGSN